jgi:two-component system LytT family response regulator
MTKLRVLIVDDEPLARARVRTFLRTNLSMEVIGECGDGIEALAAIHAEHPEIVFLDVNMPSCDGMQVLARLPASDQPVIILVTAHARFAVDALASRVIDCLLKPFDRERFEIALSRAVEQIRIKGTGDPARQLEG